MDSAKIVRKVKELRDRDFFICFLEANGWEKIGSGSYSDVYGHERETFVVKVKNLGYWGKSATNPYFNLIHPNWLEHYNVTHVANFAIAFQARADKVFSEMEDGEDARQWLKENLQEAWEDAVCFLPEGSVGHDHFDVNWHNGGELNGRAVLFDC